MREVMTIPVPVVSWLVKRRSALADEFLNSYVCWREACEDVRRAHRRWVRSTRRQRALAFAAYCAALDREEYASRVYAQCALRIRSAGDEIRSAA
jgi:hypothetical protein